MVIGLTALALGQFYPNFSILNPQIPVKREEVKKVKFVIYSDIHSDLESLTKAVVRSRSSGAEFAIITGDITTVGDGKEFKKIKDLLDSSSLPYYIVPGNHDIWLGRKVGDDIFGKYFGQSYQSFDKEGIKFILVNNADSVLGINKVTGKNGEKQADWLANEVKACLRVTCLVFMHEPLSHPTSEHIMGEENKDLIPEAKLWQKILAEAGVNDIFVGHLHSSSEYETGAVKTTVIGALSEDRNWQLPRYLEVTLEKKGETINMSKSEVTLN